MQPPQHSDESVAHYLVSRNPTKRPLLWMIIGWVGYGVCFFILYPLFGGAMSALIVLPVVLVGWLWGFRAGLLAGLLNLPLNTILLNSAGETGWDIVFRIGGGPGTVAVLFLGGIVGHLRDLRQRLFVELQQRLQMEATLRISEERFRQLTYQSPDTIYILNFSTHQMELVNREEFLGHALDELQAPGSITNQIHPEDRERVLTFWQELRAGKEVGNVGVEYRLKHKAGHWEWVLNRAIILSSTSKGQPVEVLVVLTRITESKQMEAALREREAQFQQLVETIRVIPWVADLTTFQFTYVGPQAVDMLGYPLATWYEPDFWAEHIHPEDQEDAVAFCREASQHQNHFEFEYRMHAADGQIVWFRDMVTVQRDEDGPGMLHGFMIDITERKQVEGLVNQVMAASPNALIVANRTGEILFANKSVQAIFGYEPEEIVGQHLELLIPTQFRRAHQQLQALYFVQPKTHPMGNGRDLHGLHRDGHEFPAEIALAPLERENELLVLASISDITIRKQAEDQRRQQEAYQRILFEQTPIGIVIVDMSGNVTTANPRSLEILGAPGASATVGLNVLTLPSLVKVGISPMLTKALSSGKKMEMETWYTSIWDKTVYLFIRAVPHSDGQGQQIGLIILIEDLTQRVQAEEAMYQMQKLESLNVLAGGIAHDFNNLLVAMLGQTSLALVKLQPENPGRPHVEKAVKAAEQATLLIQQLLAYSGRGRFHVTLLDLNTLINENLHLFAATIPKQVHLRTKLADNLPLVEVDIVQLQQVVMNLIINAAEAIGEKRGVITIVTDSQIVAAEDSMYWQHTMKPLDEGIYVTLEVHDDGQGMAQETLAKMFDPFFTTKEKGHGLGLAAALGIIKGHNGGLTVYSELGRGTTIKLLLPAGREPEVAEIAKPLKVSQSPSGLVLVIDDEKHVREAVADILSLEDIEVLTAPDGQSGLALYLARQVDIGLVLLDLSMPGWSGEQTMRELRKVNPHVRIILSSGYNETEATQRFAGKSLTGFLQKPYSVEKLLQVVKNYQDG